MATTSFRARSLRQQQSSILVVLKKSVMTLLISMLGLLLVNTMRQVVKSSFLIIPEDSKKGLDSSVRLS